jgi:LacI family transcriptional regulator
MKNTRHIAFVTSIDYSYAQRVVEGILQYVAKTPDLYFQTAGYCGFMPMPVSSNFHGDGVIGLFKTQAEIASYERQGMPVINVGRTIQCPRRQVCVNDYRIGELAAHSFLEYGYTHFLFITSEHFSRGSRGTARRTMADSGSSHPVAGFDRGRYDGFMSVLATINATCDVVCLKNIQASVQIWQSEQRRLRKILHKYPLRLGIFCANDMLGHLTLETCVDNGLAIPSQIGIIGVDNDKLMCHSTRPSLASVDQGEERVGFAAAQLLHQILLGREPETTILQIDPVEVVERQSLTQTDSGDPIIKTALAYMKQHLARPFRINDLVLATGLQRRNLERRFREQLGTTPAEELSRLRIEKARQQLASGNQRIKEIADRCGYSSTVCFHHAFARAFNTTPTLYRKHNRSTMK